MKTYQLVAGALAAVVVGFACGWLANPGEIRTVTKEVEQQGSFELFKGGPYQNFIRERTTGCVWSLDTYNNYSAPVLIQGAQQNQRCSGAPNE